MHINGCDVCRFFENKKKKRRGKIKALAVRVRIVANWSDSPILIVAATHAAEASRELSYVLMMEEQLIEWDLFQ